VTCYVKSNTTRMWSSCPITYMMQQPQCPVYLLLLTPPAPLKANIYSKESELRSLNRFPRFHSYMWPRMNWSSDMGASKSINYHWYSHKHCKWCLSFLSIILPASCYQWQIQTSPDSTGKGLSAEKRLVLRSIGWDWARSGPSWPQIEGHPVSARASKSNQSSKSLEESGF
jgi:hypothetical protein